MPELPEVETIRRGLSTSLVGQQIARVEIVFAGSMPVENDVVNRYVLGTEIVEVRRRGKVLIIDVSSDYSLLIHLKMTGQLILDSMQGQRLGGGHPTASMVGSLPDNSTRVVIVLESGGQLFFNDQRKFGWIKVVPTSEVEHDSLLARMGPEPLSTEFTSAYFIERLQRHSSPIKAVLLNQAVVAGLGNIYVDEALHLARIHPLRRANTLVVAEIQRLHQAVITIISLAIEHDGTTFRDYVNHMGERGNYFEQARAFNRTGLPCLECGAPIQKLRVAGRGTHICPRCQKPE